MDLALNNLQRLICHKIQTTNQPTNQPVYPFWIDLTSYSSARVSQPAYSKPTGQYIFEADELQQQNFKSTKRGILEIVQVAGIIAKCQDACFAEN